MHRTAHAPQAGLLPCRLSRCCRLSCGGGRGSRRFRCRPLGFLFFMVRHEVLLHALDVALDICSDSKSLYGLVSGLARM
jgi:hypothetical protein